MDKTIKPTWGGGLALCATLACVAAVPARAQQAQQQQQQRPFQAAAAGGREQPLNWTASLGVEQTDNIRRSSANEESETTLDAGFGLNINQHRTRYEVRLGSTFHYREYLQNSYDSDFLGAVDGHLGLLLVPDHFTWVVDDNFGQIASNERAVETPDNHQYVNLLSTGPEISIPLSARTFVHLNGRYSKVNYEDALDDSQSLGGTLGLVRQLSATKALSLNVASSHTKYDQDQINPEYNTRSAFLRFDGRGAKTTLTTDVGYSELERRNQDAESGLLVRLTFDRELGARSSLSWFAGTEFSDSAYTFRQDQTFLGVQPGNENDAAFGDPFRADYAGLAWRLSGVRSTIIVQGSWRKETHDSHTELDRRLTEVSSELQRKFSPRLTASLGLDYSRREFVQSDAQLDEWSVYVGAGWQLLRNVQASLRLQHYKGGGDTLYDSYSENRATLTISYSRSR